MPASVPKVHIAEIQLLITTVEFGHRFRKFDVRAVCHRNIVLQPEHPANIESA